MHWIIERIDERLKGDIREVKEVLALHFAAVFDQQQALNEELAQSSKDNPIEKILIDFYFDKIRPATTGADVEIDNDVPSAKNGDRQSAIWLALVFRIWAWLFLHDFDPEDAMIDRSEFKDSNLPIYIG